MKISSLYLALLFILLLFPQFSFAGFEENFEDGNLSSRGWYDNTSPVLTSQEAAPGSTASVEFRFLVSATRPINGGAMRRQFTESDAVYVSYWVKYSSNWQGSNRSYHPHEFYILTNKDGIWTGPAYTYLTAYIEQNALRSRLAIQDGRNIDRDNIGVNLVGVTEDRSVAGCNGDSDGYGTGSCYPVGGGNYWNGKSWTADSPLITAGQWHKIEAYFKLNSIVNGTGIADGVMRYWLNGQIVLDYYDVIYRTGRHPDMKFKQFIIAPWIGDGSPVDQTFWIDNLVLSTDLLPISHPGHLAPPRNLRVTIIK